MTGSEPPIGLELTPEHPPAELLALGELAETVGYDAVFCSAHYNNRDPFQVLAGLAARTDDVRLGPGVANPHETHPVALASRVATLDERSDGRAMLGLGAGDPSTLRNLGVGDEERGLRPVLETFRIARRLWAGERVDHDGAFVADDAGLNYEPPQGASLPVYVGGEGPHMCRMAATHADGLLFNGSHPDDLAWAAERVQEGLAERVAGDDAGDPSTSAAGFEFLAYASVSVAEDSAAAREAASPPVAFIAAGASPPVLDRHGLDAELAGDIGEAISAGRFSAAFELVTPAMVDAFCVAGDVADVSTRLAELLEHADGLVVGAPVGPDLEDGVRLAAEAAERAVDD